MEKVLDSFGEKLCALRKKPLLLLALRNVDLDEQFALEKVLEDSKFEELDVVLQTDGGSANQAFQMAKMISARCKKVNMIVPYYAKSAGTLICLIADEFILTELSELGPLDTQVRENHEDGPKYKSALEEFKALEQARLQCLETLDSATQMIISASGMNIPSSISMAIDFVNGTSAKLYEKFDPIKIGKYARALEIGKMYGINLLTQYKSINEGKATEIINTLVYGYPSHNYIIDKAELISLGFIVNEPNEDVKNLLISSRNMLYEQTGKVSVVKLYLPTKNDDNKKLSEKASTKKQKPVSTTSKNNSK